MSFDSRPEKKLAIALKTILALEAVAKVIIIVKGTSIEEGTLPLQRHLQTCLLLFVVVLGRLTANYILCGENTALPSLIYITDWCDLW